MRFVLLLLSLVLAATQATSHAYAQWDIEESHTTASLRGIHNVGGGVAWASGTDGTVLRTEDGGYLWQTCTIPPGAEKLDFRGVQAFDENTAIVMSSGPGDQSRLYKTTDGCQTWKLLFTNPDKEGFWDALQFIDRQEGFVLGDPVSIKGVQALNAFAFFQTSNGGETWNALHQERRSQHIYPAQTDDAVFAASNSSLLVSFTYPTFVTGGPHPKLIAARPMFWRVLPNISAQDLIKGISRSLPLAVGKAAGGFSIGETHGKFVIVGGDYTKPDSINGTAVFEGADLDFFQAITPPHGYRSSVNYDSTQKLWVTVGPNGTDISTDDGKNWRPLTPASTDPVGADKNWNALSLPFVVGPHGRIGRLRTIDQKSTAINKP
ncbi:hypothetical protein RBB77_18495 [Tunturibacter psychrotolerans]|uniref:Photosynthesis system II assembly factor Ycf48/Hcf136-like domain-containing protein n=1 Tax=Tunturiibacter psychrotolerans TaxID=3069686 RepID=A0AAU7ZMH9_9BACT